MLSSSSSPDAPAAPVTSSWSSQHQHDDARWDVSLSANMQRYAEEKKNEDDADEYGVSSQRSATTATTRSGIFMQLSDISQTSLVGNMEILIDMPLPRKNMKWWIADEMRLQIKAWMRSRDDISLPCIGIVPVDNGDVVMDTQTQQHFMELLAVPGVSLEMAVRVCDVPNAAAMLTSSSPMARIGLQIQELNNHQQLNEWESHGWIQHAELPELILAFKTQFAFPSNIHIHIVPRGEDDSWYDALDLICWVVDSDDNKLRAREVLTSMLDAISNGNDCVHVKDNTNPYFVRVIRPWNVNGSRVIMVDIKAIDEAHSWLCVEYFTRSPEEITAVYERARVLKRSRQRHSRASSAGNSCCPGYTSFHSVMRKCMPKAKEWRDLTVLINDL